MISYSCQRMMSKTKKIVLFLILNILFNANQLISFQNLSYGSLIEKLNVLDINKSLQVIPKQNCVNIIYLFNINNAHQVQILDHIDYLLIHLDDKPNDISFQAISKSSSSKFFELDKIYAGRIIFINDEENIIHYYFNYSCGNCIKILLIDKKGVIRYITTSFDPFFLKEIIERYINA